MCFHQSVAKSRPSGAQIKYCVVEEYNRGTARACPPRGLRTRDEIDLHVACIPNPPVLHVRLPLLPLTSHLPVCLPIDGAKSNFLQLITCDLPRRPPFCRAGPAIKHPFSFTVNEFSTVVIANGLIINDHGFYYAHDLLAVSEHHSCPRDLWHRLIVPSEAPYSAVTVEVVGSWDRFTKSYPLKRDRRTGPGHWRGCHTFTNITCDGDSLQVSSSRDGGLKMGGKYWYFVRSRRSQGSKATDG